MSKFSLDLLKKPNFDEIEKNVNDHASDLLEDTICKKIINVIIELEKPNIKNLIIKYININNQTVKRTIIIKVNKVSKRILERQKIKVFGKALEGNNKTKIDKEIKIEKSINIKTENNKESINKANIVEKTVSKYKPPSLLNSKSSTDKLNKYVPPSTTIDGKEYRIPQFKIKILNIDADSEEDDIKYLCEQYGQVLNCYIPKFFNGKKKGLKKDFAIVKFNKLDDMNNCLENINNMKYNNMILKANKI